MFAQFTQFAHIKCVFALSCVHADSNALKMCITNLTLPFQTWFIAALSSIAHSKRSLSALLLWSESLQWIWLNLIWCIVEWQVNGLCEANVIRMSLLMRPQNSQNFAIDDFYCMPISCFTLKMNWWHNFQLNSVILVCQISLEAYRDMISSV